MTQIHLIPNQTHQLSQTFVSIDGSCQQLQPLTQITHHYLFQDPNAFLRRYKLRRSSYRLYQKIASINQDMHVKRATLIPIPLNFSRYIGCIFEKKKKKQRDMTQVAAGQVYTGRSISKFFPPNPDPFNKLIRQVNRLTSKTSQLHVVFMSG